jgi:hypothetical protein
MDRLNIRLSEHAREVMARRSITFDEIAEIIARPLVVATGNDSRYPGNDPKRKYFGDTLCVVVAEETKHGEIMRTIITVLLKSGDQWTDEDAKGRAK